MRTRRAILIGVGGMMALAGCSQQEGQPSEEEGSEASTEEFTVEQFRVGGENPDEYEADFISGSSPEEVADELTPEVSYQIAGASEEVETEVRYEYSDATIPEGEPLDETVDGETHEESGEYAQAPSMPDSLVSEIVENPKNLVATFRATDMESEVTETQEYELNFADSFAEQIINEAYAQDRISADNEKVNVEEGTISIDYQIDSEIGTWGFNKETASVAGVYTGIVDLTRTAYDLEINVKDSNGETYERSISDNLAENYLNNEITEDQFSDQLIFNKLNN